MVIQEDDLQLRIPYRKRPKYYKILGAIHCMGLVIKTNSGKANFCWNKIWTEHLNYFPYKKKYLEMQLYSTSWGRHAYPHSIAVGMFRRGSEPY